jgi:ABC-2 type transport system permease protein
MKKYILVFQQSFSQFVTYRVNIFFQIIQNFVPPLLTLAALSFATPTGEIITKNLVSYYVLISLVSPITISNIDDDIDQLTSTGDINNFLLKPFSLFKWLYIKNLSEKLVVALILSPVIFVILLQHGIAPSELASLLVIILLSFSLSFTFSFIIGLSCFWIEDFWAIHNLKFVMIQFLGGVVLPYSFFPSSVISLIKYSPFPYLASISVKFIQHTLTPQDCFFLLAWLVILLVISNLLLQKAIAKYSYVAS